MATARGVVRECNFDFNCRALLPGPPERAERNDEHRCSPRSKLSLGLFSRLSER